MYRHREEPNFASLAAALKAGHPDAIVAFNPGVRVPVVRGSEFDDYTAGELTGDLPVAVWNPPVPSPWPASPIPSSIDGAQYHVLNFLGDWWGQGRPRFPDELVVGYTRYVNAHGGVVTWDVPISPEGRVPEEFLAQLRPLKAAGAHP